MNKRKLYESIMTNVAKQVKKALNENMDNDPMVFDVYKVEVGVLLDEDDEEYESYSNVYDKQHAYYDENVAHFLTQEDATRYAMCYVKEGVENTYGIVSKLLYDGNEYGYDMNNVNYDKRSIKNDNYLEDYISMWEGENYSMDNVIIGYYKNNNKVEVLF